MNYTIGNNFLNNSTSNYQLTPGIVNRTIPLYNSNAVLSPTPSKPLPTLVAIPLPAGSCTSCNANFAEKLSHSTIRIPIQVSSSSTANNSFRQPVLRRLRRVGENSLLEPALAYLPTPPAFQYVPFQRSGNAIKQKPNETQRFKNIVGLNKWYIRRRQNQLQTMTISKNRFARAQKMLKRLQNHSKMRQWKIEKRLNYEEMESIRESKLEMLRKKGIKAPPKTECPLWNCPRKEYKRRRPFMVYRKYRSVSSLSNLSEKSRSPIIFRRVL
ncbi:unnamed protein product [Orchesella dallaii]|uniref:Uncharacterized protein n=1 Tax=Orchesella dallaii TaxID=48710 RepID=A0ABP1QLZ5_9HEXA